MFMPCSEIIQFSWPAFEWCGLSPFMNVGDFKVCVRMCVCVRVRVWLISNEGDLKMFFRCDLPLDNELIILSFAGGPIVRLLNYYFLEYHSVKPGPVCCRNPRRPFPAHVDSIFKVYVTGHGSHRIWFPPPWTTIGGFRFDVADRA